MAFFQAHSSSVRSDAAADSPRRGSLPRLGSMSSFQNLNPFLRRRIAPPPTSTDPTQVDNTGVPWSSQEGHRKSSATTLRPKTQGRYNEVNASPATASASAGTGHGDMVGIPPPSITQPLPRSRTFSNLPIPTRLKMTPGQIPVSTSQAHFGYSGFTDRPAETPSIATRYNNRIIHPSRTLDREYVGQSSRTVTEQTSSNAPVPSMQRWNSQPLLSSTTNIRQSHGEIKQTRLMSVRQAPTPPIAHTRLAPSRFTNLADEEMASQSQRNMFRRKPVVRRDSAIMPLSPQYSPQEDRAGSLLLARVDIPGSQARIEEAEPLAYWSGRFSALIDRMCNRELERQLSLDSNLCGQDTTKSNASQQKTWQTSSIEDLHSSEATLTRTKHALHQLHSLCVTEVAKEGFRVWLRQLESAMKEPEISRLVETMSTKVSPRMCLEQDKENRPALGEIAACEAAPAGHRAKLVSRWLGKGKK